VTPYVYRCPVHGEIEVRKPMAEASRPEYCTECFLDGEIGRELRRVYTPPITDCRSFGKNVYGARTPQWKWKPQSEGQARQFRDIARREGARTQFGAGRTSGT
jgi:hypothetical protein